MRSELQFRLKTVFSYGFSGSIIRFLKKAIHFYKSLIDSQTKQKKRRLTLMLSISIQMKLPNAFGLIQISLY